jgi:hypothetical protein
MLQRRLQNMPPRFGMACCPAHNTYRTVGNYWLAVKYILNAVWSLDDENRTASGSRNPSNHGESFEPGIGKPETWLKEGAKFPSLPLTRGRRVRITIKIFGKYENLAWTISGRDGRCPVSNRLQQAAGRNCLKQ